MADSSPVGGQINIDIHLSNWKSQVPAKPQSRFHPEHPLAEPSATTLPKARNEAPRTQTSRNPRRCVHPEKELEEDGLACGGRYDKDESLQE